MSAPKTAPLGQPHVLVLEDDASLRDLLLELFASEGLEVSVFDSYPALRAAMRAFRRKIVIADFWGASQMTLSSSEREEIRELGNCAPTILLTGRAWASGVAADELNVARILPKPVTLDELLAQVMRFVEVDAR